MHINYYKTYFKVALSVLLLLSVSRFVPHPPNFTSLIALSFYIPAFFGLSYIPVVVFAFLITDIVIGFHSSLLFTWGSVIVIGLLTIFFKKSFSFRIFGVLTSAIIFFLLSNFGVWLNGSYGYSFDGLLYCYTLAIPFFTNTISSTLLFSLLIEAVIKTFTIFKTNKA